MVRARCSNTPCTCTACARANLSAAHSDTGRAGSNKVRGLCVDCRSYGMQGIGLQERQSAQIGEPRPLNGEPRPLNAEPRPFNGEPMSGNREPVP